MWENSIDQNGGPDFRELCFEYHLVGDAKTHGNFSFSFFLFFFYLLEKFLHEEIGHQFLTKNHF
jgi:hypothetical protein